jgi:hypothetical protein
LNEKGPMECLKLAGHLNGLAWEQGDQMSLWKNCPKLDASHFLSK